MFRTKMLSETCYSLLAKIVIVEGSNFLCKRAGKIGVLPFGMDTFPDDVIRNILSHLSYGATSPKDLLSAREVSKQWNKLAKEPSVLQNASQQAVSVTAEQWSEKSSDYLESLADSGSLEATYMLGMIYFYCIPGGRIKGSKLLLKAGKLGHAASLFAASLISFNGSGWGRESKNVKMGISLCLRAAALGHVNAIRELAHCLLDGFGIGQDQSEGWRLLLMAYLRERKVEKFKVSEEEREEHSDSKKRKHNHPQLRDSGKKRIRGNSGNWRDVPDTESTVLEVLCGHNDWDFDLSGNRVKIELSRQQELVEDLLQGSKSRLGQLALNLFPIGGTSSKVSAEKTAEKGSTEIPNKTEEILPVPNSEVVTVSRNESASDTPRQLRSIFAQSLADEAEVDDGSSTSGTNESTPSREVQEQGTSTEISGDSSRLDDEELWKLIGLIGSRNPKDVSPTEIKPLLTKIQTVRFNEVAHPAHGFLLGWFRDSPGENNRRGVLPEGAMVCRRQICGRPETRPMEFWRCSSCWTARYCSRNCQLQDWQVRHCDECQPNLRNAILNRGQNREPERSS